MGAFTISGDFHRRDYWWSPNSPSSRLQPSFTRDWSLLLCLPKRHFPHASFRCFEYNRSSYFRGQHRHATMYNTASFVSLAPLLIRPLPSRVQPLRTAILGLLNKPCPTRDRVPLIIPDDFLTSVNNYGLPAAILNKSY